MASFRGVGKTCVFCAIYLFYFHLLVQPEAYTENFDRPTDDVSWLLKGYAAAGGLLLSTAWLGSAASSYFLLLLHSFAAAASKDLDVRCLQMTQVACLLLCT